MQKESLNLRLIRLLPVEDIKINDHVRQLHHDVGEDGHAVQENDGSDHSFEVVDGVVVAEAHGRQRCHHEVDLDDDAVVVHEVVCYIPLFIGDECRKKHIAIVVLDAKNTLESYHYEPSVGNYVHYHGDFDGQTYYFEDIRKIYLLRDEDEVLIRVLPLLLVPQIPCLFRLDEPVDEGLEQFWVENEEQLLESDALDVPEDAEVLVRVVGADLAPWDQGDYIHNKVLLNIIFTNLRKRKLPRYPVFIWLLQEEPYDYVKKKDSFDHADEYVELVGGQGGLKTSDYHLRVEENAEEAAEDFDVVKGAVPAVCGLDGPAAARDCELTDLLLVIIIATLGRCCLISNLGAFLSLVVFLQLVEVVVVLLLSQALEYQVPALLVVEVLVLILGHKHVFKVGLVSILHELYSNHFCYLIVLLITRILPLLILIVLEFVLNAPNFPVLHPLPKFGISLLKLLEHLFKVFLGLGIRNDAIRLAVTLQVPQIVFIYVLSLLLFDEIVVLGPQH